MSKRPNSVGSPIGSGMAESETELGTFIRARRIKLGLSQTALAEKVGLCQNSISALEMGVRKYFKDDKQLNVFAEALRCSPKKLQRSMPMKNIAQPKTDLGRLIYSRREELGLSIENFAKKMKMTPEKARRLETRKNPSIHYGLIKPLSKALKIPPSDLIRFVTTTTTKPTKSEFGQLIRNRRKELMMSTNDLAKKLHVSKELISRIELGKYSLSKNDGLVKRLAKALKMDFDELQAVRPVRKMKKARDNNSLGGFLTKKRLTLGLTQREVCQRVKISTSVYSNIEMGNIYPNVELLDRLTKVLNRQIPSKLTGPTPSPLNIGRRGRPMLERKTVLGDFVTRRRLELHLSQIQVARRAATNTTIISNIERGEYPLDSRMLEKISMALECEIPSDILS